MAQDFPTRWFLIKYPEFFKALIRYVYPLNIDFIERYKDKLDWYDLSMRDDIPWSIDFMKQYEEWICWGEGDADPFPCWINNNEAIPWSIELIEAFEDKWQWELLSQNEVIATNDAIVSHFKDKLNLEYVEHTRKLIEKENNKPKVWWKPMKLTVDDYIRIMHPSTPDDFYTLSKNENLIWDMETFFMLEDKLNWHCLSENVNLPWSKQLIEFFKDKWFWGIADTPGFSFADTPTGICSNEGIYWDLEMIEKFEDKINWLEISYNDNVAWSLDLVDKYSDRVDWIGILRRIEKIWDPYFAPYLNDEIVDEIFEEITGLRGSCAPY